MESKARFIIKIPQILLGVFLDELSQKKSLLLHNKHPEMRLKDKFLPTNFPKRVLKSSAARSGELSKQADSPSAASSGFPQNQQGQYRQSC